MILVPSRLRRTPDQEDDHDEYAGPDHGLNTEATINQPHTVWHYLSNATCLMRPQGVHEGNN